MTEATIYPVIELQWVLQALKALDSLTLYLVLFYQQTLLSKMTRVQTVKIADSKVINITNRNYMDWLVKSSILRVHGQEFEFAHNGIQRCD